MKKIVTKILVIALAVVSAMSIALFAAACGDKVPEGKVLVTVVDENGNPINGKTFGESDYDPSITQVKIQFCIAGNSGACSGLKDLGEDGKVMLDINNDILKDFGNSLKDSDVLEVHVRYVGAKGYFEGDSSENNGKAYAQFKKSEFPSKIEIKLEKK